MLELLLPQRCVVCSRSGTQLCEPCRKDLPRLRPPLCERCGSPAAWPVRRCVECTARRVAFSSARAAVVYDDRVRKLVGAWKEHGLRRLACAAAEVVAQAVPRPGTQLVTFVPPSRDRMLRRGHHPAQSLARELGALWELEVAALLLRKGPARRQRGSALAERRRNVRGAFQASGTAPRSIVLVDDVYTSGATANAAASALRKAGARRIEVVTFARALRLR